VDGPRSLPRRGIKSRLLQFNTNNGYVPPRTCACVSAAAGLEGCSPHPGGFTHHRIERTRDLRPRSQFSNSPVLPRPVVLHRFVLDNLFCLFENYECPPTFPPISIRCSRCRYIFTIVSYLIGVFIFATIVGESPFLPPASNSLPPRLLLLLFVCRTSGQRDNEPQRQPPGIRTPAGRGEDLHEAPQGKVHSKNIWTVKIKIAVGKVCLNSKFPPTLHSTLEIQPATLFGEKCVRLYL
jgi:hypothetical protein